MRRDNANERVGKRYKGFALETVNLALPEGCILGLIGENGAGKTTLIKLLLGMAQGKGEIRVLGRDIRREGAAIRQETGVVLDEACFPEGLDALQVNRVLRDTYTHWREDEFFRLLKRLSLPERKPFKEFSRGMKMKLAIAAALSHEAKLLILDEPTGGLDPIVRDEILDLFYDFTRDAGHSILISSRIVMDLEQRQMCIRDSIVTDLEKLCDYVAFLHQGRLLFLEEKDALLERYGVVRCSKAECAAFAPGTVRGMREGAYGVEALCERALLPRGVACTRPSVEDVIVLTAKEGLK